MSRSKYLSFVPQLPFAKKMLHIKREKVENNYVPASKIRFCLYVTVKILVQKSHFVVALEVKVAIFSKFMQLRAMR